MNGVLVVDKPRGPTSHDVVARARRALRTSRIGHTGTLDPLATGVLPLLVGRATRLAQFLSTDKKEYLADVRVGGTTPTYDAEGRVACDASGAPLPVLPPPFVPACATAEVIDEMLAEFRGVYWQMPPPFSAKKVGGTRAYTLARSSRPVELKPVQVQVETLELLSYEHGLVRLRILCSSGFYVRTLAHDLGQRLRCGAYLEGLRRTRAGDFALEEAVTLDTLESEGERAGSRIIAMERLLPELPAVTLNDRGVRRACHGNALAAEDLAGRTPEAGRVRLLDPAGALLAIAEPLPGGLLHPSVVLV